MMKQLYCKVGEGIAPAVAKVKPLLIQGSAAGASRLGGNSLAFGYIAVFESHKGARLTGPEGWLWARGKQAGAVPSRGAAEGSPQPSRARPHPVRPAEREARASRGGAGPAGSGEGRWRDGPRPPPEKGLRAGAPGSRAALTVEDCREQRRFREARRAATTSFPGPLLRRWWRQRRWRRP